MKKLSNYQRRTQHWVHSKLQGGLAVRVVLYWFVCVLSMGSVLMVGAAFSDIHAPANAITQMLWSYFLPALFASLLVLPIVVIDSIRHSNRVVGAFPRFQHAMKRLAHGESTSPLIVREGDAWKEMADCYNRIALRIEELETVQHKRSATASSKELEEALPS